MYEQTTKSFINFHANHTQIDRNFLEDRFHFWDTVLHRQRCTSFHWYQIGLLVGILLLALVLLFVYIFYNAKRSRRNIKPTEAGNSDIVTTTYRFLSPVAT